MGAGPLKYSLSMLFPFTAMLSVFGAAYGHTWVLAALQLIPQQVTSVSVFQAPASVRLRTPHGLTRPVFR